MGGVAEVTLVALRVLREVAATGSFTAAAESLGYTQSAVSRQVAALEHAVGDVLFERERRGVVVTAAGEVLLDHAVAALGQLDTAERRLGELRGELRGRLVVGAFPSAAAWLVPLAVAAVLARHRGVRVRIDEAATPTLLRRLRTGRVSVAVIGTGHGLPDYDLAGLARHTLLADDLRVAVPPGHRLARRATVRPADLAGERWIVGAGPAGEPQFGAWPTVPDPDIAFAVRQWPTRLGLVAAGLGVTVIPGVAAASVPHGVTVLPVVDPTWPGRAAVAVTATDPAPGVAVLVRELRVQAQRLRPATEPAAPS